MAFEGVPGGVGEVRTMTTAAGGTALSTTPVFVEIPDGAAYLSLTVGTFQSGALAVKFAKCPYLLVLKTTDKLVATGNTTDYSAVAQDAVSTSSVDLSAFPAVAAKNFLYVGAAQPFRGVAVVNANANSNNSVLTVNYWNGIQWNNTNATDGTASGGDSMAQNGNVTWTVPTDWVKHSLAFIEGAGLVPCAAMGAYWTRWEFSAALSATVKNSKMVGMNRDTNYAELLAANLGGVVPWFETVMKGLNGFAAIEALTDQGTAKIDGLVATLPGFQFVSN